MNGKFNWNAVLQTVVAGLAVAGILFAFSVSTRLTQIETATEQEQKGYNIALKSVSERLNRMEDKLDILVGKAHTHREGQ